MTLCILFIYLENTAGLCRRGIGTIEGSTKVCRKEENGYGTSQIKNYSYTVKATLQYNNRNCHKITAKAQHQRKVKKLNK